MPEDLQHFLRINQERIVEDAKALALKSMGQGNVAVPAPFSMTAKIPDPNETGAKIDQNYDTGETTKVREWLAEYYRSWVVWRIWLVAA